MKRRPRRRKPDLAFWPEPASPKRNRGALAVVVLSACLVVAGLLLRYGGWEPGARDLPAAASSAELPAAGPGDTLSMQFIRCSGRGRDNCVVDGDTFWFAGDTIRIADINTPEISSPECDAELALGEQATDRLQQLLNAGPFSLASIDRDTDRYGRKLRIVERGGSSLGDVLVAEGLAEEWKGYRSGWC